ncbi:Gypsy retrotransposon integrase-like protein 1 [Tetrabaena socialis]|uniref:Gypsy retrotransposon integrase-like protein 1 n=1 Tax=Tetrabaena socialis TaxID=47790 RepID=A0A2J7ZRL4_9CHLO|nr:Gypsy retrotransposon integrase-like protein 1 [Tetrabaena socialis]|eukprot:PNH02898.1 Gypsy retrotransposon integrase-like protein 1 [Tetrabaena socialis]
MHGRLGHLGVRRTLALLQLGHWWYGMRQDVQAVVRERRACDLSSARGTQRPMQLHSLPVRGLFYRWGVDGGPGGPMAESAVGHRYCIVAIEHFSKHVEIVPLKDKAPAAVARAWSDVLARFGAPAEVVTDNGTEFAAKFAELLARCVVDRRTTSPGHPQAVAAERIVKASTSYSPYQLLYGGIVPVVPPAAGRRERFQQPLDFEDAAAAAKSLMQRSAWVRQAYPAAAGNLLIAQHRDTLRYSAVWARNRRRVEQLLPCHLPVDPIVDPRLFRPERDLQCEA